ncbi:hypothetical protein [Mesorhizobium sp. B2-4-17]|uniref:hypothetical protein n=1 Tax=Mesorhizobium sp. B2-4-17 TaxID=2589932 RepID=UPI00112B04A6|nr:hypothetical protein [Mesorhizobium sp. B2-4-17]TPK78210.1 hypothetical protein FJ548_25080 [Mesorhizobium sp. B2-4-17]
MQDVDTLYGLLTKQPRHRTTRELLPDDRRAYLAAAARKHRQRQRAAQEQGSPEPTAPIVRAALADAAIMLLATDGSGSEEIRNWLGKVFAGRAGVPGTVTAKARSGRLKPKLLDLK